MDVLAEIEAYLNQTGMAPSTFGMRVLNDGKFVWRLRERPMGITLTTVEKVRQWMRDNPPAASAAA